MLKRVWDVLHKLDTASAIATAALGGSAVTTFVQGGAVWLLQPSLPWWGYFVVAAGLSAAALYIILRGSRRTNCPVALPSASQDAIPTTTAKTSEPPLSVLWVTINREDRSQDFIIRTAIRNDAKKLLGIRLLGWDPHPTFKLKLTKPMAVGSRDSRSVPVDGEFPVVIESSSDWNENDLNHFRERHELGVLKFRVDNRDEVSVVM